MASREEMVEDLRESPVMWKRENSGFMEQPGWVVLVDKDEDPFKCFRIDEETNHSRDCRESWATVFGLAGDTREEAETARDRGEYLGAAHHLADCELLDDRPPEWTRYFVVAPGVSARVWARKQDEALSATSSRWSDPGDGDVLRFLEVHGPACSVHLSSPKDPGRPTACDGPDCLLLTDVSVPDPLTADGIRQMVQTSETHHSKISQRDKENPK